MACIVNTRDALMSQLRFDLRLALLDFEARTGLRLTYEALSQTSEIAVDTLKSMATRDDYNATLRIISAICNALKCEPAKYLLWASDPSKGRDE